jgi:hypothetical protein
VYIDLLQADGFVVEQVDSIGILSGLSFLFQPFS